MLNKNFIKTTATGLLVLAILSCKRESWDTNSITAKDAQSNTYDINAPQASEPVLYFTEDWGNSSWRAKFLKATKLGGAIPQVQTLTNTDKRYVPGSEGTDWCIHDNLQQIWYFTALINNNNSFTDYIERYNFTLPFPGGTKSINSDAYGRREMCIDEKNNLLYYLDEPKMDFGTEFYRSDINGNNAIQIHYDSKIDVWAMDIDFVGKKIYFTDRISNSICVMDNIIGSKKQTIIPNAGISTQFINNAYTPRLRDQIKVDNTTNRIYWVKEDPINKSVAIMSALTSGALIKKLWETKYADEKTYSIRFDIDKKNQKIFVCYDVYGPASDKYLSFVFRMDVDGKNIQPVYKPSGRITQLAVAQAEGFN